MKSKLTGTFVGSALALILATSCCWVPWLAIAVGSASGLAALNEGLGRFSNLFLLTSLVLLSIGVYQFYNKRNVEMGIQNPVLESTFTCPECGHSKKEEMPTDACQFFYECENCITVLKPMAGDCCVYCSYGSVPCPPIQMNTDCC